MAIHVNVDNFVQAETARMLADIQRDAGSVNTFRHNRTPAPIDQQTVIRLNRDTLYSFAVVDLAGGASVTLPEPGKRYVSTMIVNEDHLVTDVFHGAGTFELSQDTVGSRHALVAIRSLVDPEDADDLSAVAALQDGYQLKAAFAEPFVGEDYDTASLDETRDALLRLAAGLSGFDRMFGTSDQISPVRHLIGTAAGWGGLPTTEATYVGVDPRRPPGNYELELKDVPVDAFWSISVYNAAGYFEPNESGRYTVNSVTAIPNDDGSVTVRFVADDAVDGPNTIPTPEGWNFLVRLYQPRAKVLDGKWQLPGLVESARG